MGTDEHSAQCTGLPAAGILAQRFCTPAPFDQCQSISAGAIANKFCVLANGTLDRHKNIFAALASSLFAPANPARAAMHRCVTTPNARTSCPGQTLPTAAA